VLSLSRKLTQLEPTMRRGRASLAVLIVALLLPACLREASPPAAGPAETKGSARPRAIPVRNEIPSGEVEAVMTDHLQGLGHMERYEYDQAAKAFARVHERAPGWIPGSINLALALLNQTGNEAEKSKTAGGGAPRKARFDQALELLGDVLARDPNNLHAHYARAIILQYQGEIARAHDDYAFVTEHDPRDGHAWYGLGATLADPTSPETVKRQIEIFTRALECNPYLAPVLYNLQLLRGRAGDRAGQKAMLDLWIRLNPDRNIAGTGESAAKFYGEMGRYASVINPIPAPRVVEVPGLPPRFDPPEPLNATLPEGDRWVKADDFVGPLAVIGRVRARFGAAVAVFDANGDGRLDLYLAAAVKGPKGVRDALLINQGEGAFEDATERLGLPADRASLGVAAGDFDADRWIDLFLTGVGDNRLYHRAEKGFEDVTERAAIKGPAALSLSARWLDIDQDGDLDLYVINYTDREHAGAAFTDKPPPGVPNAAYRNDGKPAPISGRPQDNWAPPAVAPEDLPSTAGLSIALTPWPGAESLLGGTGLHTAMAVLDLDDDRDLDLVVSSDGGRPEAILNDRLGRFHTSEVRGFDGSSPISGLLVTDFDKDGRADLVATRAGGRVFAWRNTTDRSDPSRTIQGESWPIDANDWSSAVAADLDLDTWPDLIGLVASVRQPTLEWARNEGKTLANRPLVLGPDASAEARPAGFAYADLAGQALPDLLLVGDGVPPRLAVNRGNGRHWLALDLSGRWRSGHDRMRTNPHGLGVRLALEGQGLNVPYDHTTPEASLAQSVAPIVLGMGALPSAALLRLRWPDGTMQSELNVPADQTLALVEHNRKTGSCPVLFTWNGERFVCLGDFLGGGGVGYLVAPGVYSQPDRDEALAIAPDQLRAEGNDFRLAIVEPMDEVAYLDHLTLDVVDTPPGVSATPDERFAPEGPRPTGALVTWRTAIEPVRAADHAGHDVTDLLRAWDRRTVDSFQRLWGWTGYTEEHGIVLDFGSQLRNFGPGDSLVLCLAGWVEYPYSQTNYAAATAGVALRPPALERLRDDGTWEVIEPHAGYPAGLPRMTTLDLTGKLTGPRCTLRLRTNMECYWDQAFLAVRDAAASVRVTSLPVARAMLGYRGYCREVSPDGRLPLLYDYEHVDPAPLARLAGRLTRYGDVAELLQSDDDRLCLVGPGDEVRLAFDARQAPVLPEGWTRRFVFRSVGYCKDADPLTATSDSIEPLPWRSMPAFPFGINVSRPKTSIYMHYLRTYQTRFSGAPM
jgi:tetratricopeptide (TPR) repeat protein